MANAGMISRDKSSFVTGKIIQYKPKYLLHLASNLAGMSLSFKPQEIYCI